MSIRGKLAAFGGEKISVRTYKQDKYDDFYARGFLFAFKSAGLEVDFQSYSNVLRSGITIRHGGGRKEIGNALCNAIMQAKLGERLVCSSTGATDDQTELTVIIGPPSN